ncbi:MAG: crossover junction endodeoxyribonuclease RuvC [Candidatus Omnitrophica bacterium]|nr:crossover junction endodeoxyribonuclease RuvC [Candidatus Omnitrophota bacterium]
MKNSGIRRILGIDPALSVTGYGIIDAGDDRVLLVKAGVIKTSPRQPLPDRLNKIYVSIIDVVSEYKPEVMVLEKIFVHYQHPTTAFLLGQARGIICLACASAGLPLIEYSATRVKKAIVGQGLASKLQVQRMVGMILNLAVMPRYLDVTDALALAIAYNCIGKADCLSV